MMLFTTNTAILLDWPSWLPNWESLTRSLLTSGAIVAALITVLKPWTRERLFALLRSGKLDHQEFVTDVMCAPDQDAELAERMFRVLRNEDFAATHRKIVERQFGDELMERRQMRRDLDQIGHYVAEAIKRNEVLDDFVRSATMTQQHMATTVALLSQSVDSMKETFQGVSDELRLMRQDNDSTRRYVSVIAHLRRDLDREGMRARGATRDERGSGPSSD